MHNKIPSHFVLQAEVQEALAAGTPVVALESTVITHGLPFPENLSLATKMQAVARAKQATPATIAVINGEVRIGLDDDSLEQLARDKKARKISVRDFGAAISQKASGGTTVAGTLLTASEVGIKVFATGGIGGVHRDAPFDISNDLSQLAISPLVVVCTGAKAILDLPATLEKLETLAVPVIGYQTDEFPAFYSRESGLPVSARADTPEEVAAIAKAHWELAGARGLLVAAPPPAESALPAADVEKHIRQALDEAGEQRIIGQAVTPFLLARVSELSGGASLKANLALLLNNASIAAQIAAFLYESKGKING
jgi:pseudouridine-5'-phosphate glycosidase